jgi:hypothetical protein
MKKSLCFFLFFFLFLCGALMADTIGLRAGLYADSPDVLTDKRQYFLSPHLEYERRFGNIDVYAEGEYTFNLTGLYPQFFFTEERIGLHLPLDSRSEFQFKLQNENDIRFDPEKGGGQGVGRVQPAVSYGLFFLWGDISLALGLPLTYSMWGGENTRFGLEPRAAYVTPFWLGFEAAVTFVAAPAVSFDGMEFAINYTGEQYFGELAFKAEESFSSFRVKVEFNYFFNFFIIKAGVEVGNLTDTNALTLGPAIGIKYRF